MFGLGLDEIFLIIIISLIFIDPKHWNSLSHKIGNLIGRYQAEIRKFRFYIIQTTYMDDDSGNETDDPKKNN